MHNQGDVCCYLTQFLTGYDGYRGYLHRYRHDGSEYISEYGDPEHELIVWFISEREQLELLLRTPLQVKTINLQMFEFQEVWNAVSCNISCI